MAGMARGFYFGTHLPPEHAMNPSPVISFVGRLVLYAVCLGALVATPGGAEDAVSPEIAALQAKFDEKVKLEIMEAHDSAVTDLKTKFLAALERTLEVAKKGGSLEEALTLKKEREAALSGQYSPLSDDPGTPSTLKGLRKIYRDGLARLEADKERKLRPLKDAFAKALEGHIVAMTKAGDLEKAIQVKKLREGLIAPPVVSASAIGTEVGSKANDRVFANSIGMRFVPLPGTRVLICIHETRRADYALFASDSPGADTTWKTPFYRGVPVGEADDHPVSGVGWSDAQAFCIWLSKKENRVYRLPTDREWSIAVGIGGDDRPMETPHQLDKKVRGRYPWGSAWPPTFKSGNFGDDTAVARNSAQTNVQGYDDGFATTAPVMSFRPNRLGLYDLGGNVWEWCVDSFDPGQGLYVLRGASWQFGDEDRLISSCRTKRPPDDRNVDGGFRCVLESP